MFKCTCKFTALHLKTNWIGTRSVPSPFFIPTILFLILANASWNGSVFACNTACSIAAEMNKTSEYGTVQQLAKTAQHSSTANRNGLLGDVTRLVATEHVRIKCSLLQSLCPAYCCILSKLIDSVKITLTTALSS